MMEKIWDLGCVTAIVGANWNNSGNAGPFYWNLNNSSGNTNINIGGRHFISKCKIQKSAPYLPCRLAKMQPKRARFSKLLKHLEANEK